MPLQYLLWDHDGVLVDTERWYFEATRTLLSQLGVELTQERYLELMADGRQSWDLARERGIPEEEIQARRADRNVLYQEFLRSHPIEIDGVSDVLEELGSRYQMAIITTAKPADMQVIHEGRDLLRHFAFVLKNGDYSHSKPHPAPYLAGLDRFGAAPNEAIAIEDSSRGLKSAIAAGMRCIVVQNEFTASQDFSGAWRVVDSVREVVGVVDAFDVEL